MIFRTSRQQQPWWLVCANIPLGERHGVVNSSMRWRMDIRPSLKIMFLVQHPDELQSAKLITPPYIVIRSMQDSTPPPKKWFFLWLPITMARRRSGNKFKFFFKMKWWPISQSHETYPASWRASCSCSASWGHQRPWRRLRWPWPRRNAAGRRARTPSSWGGGCASAWRRRAATLASRGINTNSSNNHSLLDFAFV